MEIGFSSLRSILALTGTEDKCLTGNYMFKNKLILLMMFLMASTAYGRKLMKCELARELLWLGLSRTAIPDWVCLIEAESHMQTDLVTGPLSDGSSNLGLFQINSKIWCGVKEPGGDCNVKCSQLVTRGIKKSVNCAEIIFEKMGGFSYWAGWRQNCEVKQLPNLDKCFDKMPWKTTTIPNPFKKIIFPPNLSEVLS
ncbi:lysozyme isoform X2 [Halyomorpha halys]|uniref:lysozyme isoform X2 n=1 Tax=Halyomorpha halys TaxID=286706 RepID=UPI0006D4FB91|nr:lysozyme-like isoform X2 [Halyomorpha halys]